MNRYYRKTTPCFPSDFFNEEERDCFLVDNHRKKIWAVLLDIYTEFARVCQKHNIKFAVNGGTLLGAIRHKGFIPWDDDFDVALYRDDFEKLCKVSKEEFCEPYFFQYALSDRSFFIGYARLRRSDTTGLVKKQSDYVYNNGIYLDIYVYDKAPLNDKEMMKHLKRVNFYGELLNNYYHIHPRKNSFGRLNLIRKRIIRAVFRFFVSYERLYEKYKKISSKYNKTDSDRLIFFCTTKFYKYEATFSGFTKTSLSKFEFLDVFIPSDFEYELTKAYGDYNVLPKVEERGKWHSDSVIFDPDVSYLDYLRLHKKQYDDVLKDYDNK